MTAVSETAPGRPLRVLLVHSFYYPRGGDSVHALALERLLRQHGVETGVFAIRHPESIKNSWDSYWVENVEFREMDTPLQKLQKAARSVASRDAAGKMRRMIEAFRPDVAHLHSIHHHLTLSILKPLVDAGVPIVWTLHDYRTVCPSSHMRAAGENCERCKGGHFFRALPMRCKSDSVARTAAAVAESYVTRIRRSLENVDRFVAPSRFMADAVRFMGLPNSRVTVLPNFVMRGELRQAPSRRSGILFVGRISEEKGLPQLIRAMRLLPDTPLHVVGDGPQRAFAESQAQSDGAGATFHGWCTTEETYALMDSSAVLCVPSLWYENCPTVVLEAFARRLPVVGSNQGGTLELLEGGKSGAVVDPRDSLGLAAALAVATEDGEWRAQVVEHAYRRFSTVYSPQAYSSGILDLYAELVDRKVS